ncbi:MAG: hypothetical protein RLW62_04915, partial [Gammaproteobacteria bacterium]
MVNCTTCDVSAAAGLRNWMRARVAGAMIALLLVSAAAAAAGAGDGDTRFGLGAPADPARL